MALTRVTSGGIAPGIVIKFDSNNTPTNPAISFNGDENTGMYRSGPDEISFSTAGVKRLTITSDGKVKSFRDQADTTGTILGGTNPDFVNARNIMLYVNQSDLNATDAIDNDGGNVSRPFKTIERALLEAARRSYVADTGSSTPGVDYENDKFEAYTIMVMPGDYEIDNRPGVIGLNNLTFSNFATELYKFNPKNGGVIVPRGTSIVGYDLRKTVIRPKYVPNPSSALGSDTSDNLSISHIAYDAANMIEKARGYIQEQAFLYTQSQYPSLTYVNDKCKRDLGYFIDGLITDLRQGGNANSFIVGELYTNGTTNVFLNSPTERAATIVAFNYARDVAIKAANAFIGSNAYTSINGSTIAKPTYTAGTDYTQGSGNCADINTALTTLTSIVTTIITNPDTYTTLVNKTPGVFERTAIFKVTGGCYFWQMTFKDAKTAPFDSVSYSNGVPTFTTAANPNYSHHRVVSFTYADQRTSDGELELYYKKIDQWDTTLDGGNARKARREEYEIVGDRSRNTTIDTVNSCSPYIFNCSLRSVFGLCGMHTDGNKVAENSFKSMVVAQFTGISLQRDPNAFFQPKDAEGDVNNTNFNDPAGLTNPPIYADPDAEYRPEWRHFHIKATDGAFIQVVSVFAVGYADQFLSETGGDMSITNSNSNFGQISLRAKGSQFVSFAPAAQGKITALIPPRGISSTPSTAEFFAIDYSTTWQKNGQGDKTYNGASVSTFTSNINQFRIYLDIGGLNSENDIPELIVDSFNYTTNSTVTKRFLTFGSNGNYNLFRDYYSTTGVVPAAQAKIQTTVENESGGVNVFTATLSLSGTTSAETTGGNAQRQGYFWDSSVNKVYVKVNADDAATDAFLSGFIFATTSEAVFTTTEKTNPDGSIQIVTGTSNITVLKYFDGFPSTLTTSKFLDGRASQPADLLWRVEYTIPKSSTIIPKPPEKRFIIKGTRPENGADDLPYTDYRFMVYDVEEITSWEKNIRDGKYYLTLVRADVNLFVDGTSNNPETITRRPLGITAGTSFTTNVIEELNNYDKDTRVASNINYLYPSINEEGPVYDIRRIWNPPQTDSRVLVEAIGGGKRVKDLSVPNSSYYYSGIAATPFKDLPSLTSITAETVHRLVQALDLRYAGATAASGSRVAVAPVVSWDDRSSAPDYTTGDVNIYGSGSFRFGINGLQTTISSTTSQNLYGIDGESDVRRIAVVAKNTTYTVPTSSDATQITLAAPTIPLYRPSILRASSHTWEYVGLGSGNYSTGFPNLQTRVLKPYEQFIAQGYENSGGFVASSGTNSNGDFYIGSTVVQAGGTSTVTLNVPKVRKSSESNYVDIGNIENRISNAVVNVTATTSKNSAGQSALKALSNFFNTAKLSVTDRATIQNLIINERLYIANTRIANGEKFPEANQEAYGFVKGARPEKTGFISTDTNDRLYVSPKYLDAWRIKRQLISASNITLDNNRVYVQPLNRTLIDNIDAGSVALTTTSTTIKLKESSGIPSYGIVDVNMKLQYVDINDFKLAGSIRTYLNPIISVALNYTGIDYTTNIVTLNSNQNYTSRQGYLENILGTAGYTSVIKHWSNPIDDGQSASEKDIKYLRSNLTQNVVVNTVGAPIPSSPKSIFINTSDFTEWPDRGAVTLREFPTGGTYRYSTYVYYKGTTTGELVLIRKVSNASGNDAGHTYTINYNNNTPGVPSKNVFFSGCTTTVSFADRWAKEEPFIPSVESISEDIDLESATLYTVPEKVDGYTGNLDENFVNNSLPNPFSSKALGVNLQNRQAVKKFTPLTTFAQVKQWCNISGFGVNDNVELLLKPGYYKLDGSEFPCQITINGTGLQKSNILAGKEKTGTSQGRMGGYLESTVKRGDSIYLYRSPSFYDQWGRNSDAFYSSVSGGLSSKGGFNISNIHFLGLNETVTKNEILDETYSGDREVSEARKLVRKAYYIKGTNSFPAAANGVAGGLAFTANSTAGAGVANMIPYLRSDDILVAALGSSGISGDTSTTDGSLSSATFATARYMNITLNASEFSGTSELRQKFIWARNYIIPGTTLYWLPAGGNITNATPTTKVVNVKYTNRSIAETWTGTSTEKIEILIAVYQNTTNNINKGNSASYTNPTEDLDVSAYIAGQNATIVFANQDGAEFTTLAYNWCVNHRRSFLPKGFAWGGGYQGAIIRTTVGTASSGATSITLNSVTDLKNGDVIYGPGIPVGSTITLSGGNTIQLSNATTAQINADTKVSFTQIDDFGNLIAKFDTPEIFGVINGYDRGTINLVVDLNPSLEIDPTIRPYPVTAFSNYVAMLMQFRTDTNEDGAVTLPYKYNGFKRITGSTSTRYVLLQVNPNDVVTSADPTNPNANINPYIDNSGINAGILSRFGGFTPFSLAASGGYGTGASFTGGTVTFSNVSTTAGIDSVLTAALASGGSNYTSAAIVSLIPQAGATGAGANIYVEINSSGTITGFAVGGTISTNYNGTFTASISDAKGYIMVNGRLVNTSTTSFRNDDEFIAVSKANLLAPICPYLRTGSSISTAIGKNIYLNWPYSHRALRKRFLSASLPNTGNFCSPVVNVDAIPGSNVPFTLNNCTIGAQSPSDTSANRFGGGYAGGLIRARGSNLRLLGTRFRGNLSLDWTGLLYTGSSRSGGSFTYGHSVELLQMEDENKFSGIGTTGATRIGVARDDEDFQRVTEFTPDACVYLEPSRDPYGSLSDADARTFPISSYQAIRRYNLGDTAVTIDGTTINPGELLTKTSISERFETPNPIYYNDLSTGYVGSASGFRLRWNNTASNVSNASSVGGTLAPRQLSFLYAVTDDDVVKNIFVGAFASKLIKTTNIATSYGTVTRVQLPTTAYNAAGTATSGGAYRLCLVTFSGSVPLYAAAGSSLKFLTNFLTTNRYKYVTTATSRYSKVNYQGHSQLNLVETGTQYEVHADIKVEKTGTPTTNLARSSVVYLVNNRDAAGTTPGRAYLTTDGSGNISTLDFISYGEGHLESDTFTIKSAATGGTTVTSGITLTAVRNLTDDIEMFEPGEFIGVLPSNCFVLNSINNPSVANLKTAIQKAKTIFKPGSYVNYGGTYYKVAGDSVSYQNKPYIGVYKYVNENNVSDIRANIVVMLEDLEYTPTYASNTRFDVYENDNLLDYWPTSGRCMIGNLELCDFVKGGDPTTNTGYTITLTRSMTKYFPSYVRDWEGLDPFDSLSEDVTVESFIPTQIRLADPVDVTCYGLKRITPSATTAGVENVTTDAYIDPRGKYTNKVAKVSIPSTASILDADAEKLSIGQIVHIPYRNHSFEYGSASAFPNTNLTFTAGAALDAAGSNISTNRAGNLRISGRVSSSTIYYTNYRYQYQILGTSNTNNSIYNSVNPLATAKLYWAPYGNNRESGTGYYLTPQGIRFYDYRWFTITGSYTAGVDNALLVTGDTIHIQTPGSYTATLSSGILNVTSVASGGVFLGQSISGSGIPANAYISDYARPGNGLTGRGGTGTYRISVAGVNSTATAASTAITGTEPAGGNDYSVYYPGQGGYWDRVITSKSYNASNGITTLTFNSTVSNNFSGGSILIYSYGAADDNAVLLLDKALFANVSSGTQLGLGMSLAYNEERSTNKSRMFKTRILDIAKDTVNNRVDIYFTDEKPWDFDAAGMRNYGFMFVNFGGWTYPKTGGSSFRVNNVKLGTAANNVYLPNRSGRIQPGDTLTYTYENDTVTPATMNTVTATISSVGAIDGNGFSLVTHSGSGILFSGYASKQNWLSIEDIFVSHRTGNFVSNGPVADKFIFSDTGLKMTFGEYNMWYEKISNYISATDGVTGRAGWVGNFAISNSGKLTDGLKLEGASAIQWGRQYNYSMWLAATPITPRWVGFNFERYNESSYSTYMAQIQSASSIETLISNQNTNAIYDGAGAYNFYPINHTSLAYGNLYAGLNTAQFLLGAESYDTQQYRWSTGNTKLIVGLQDASIDPANGNVSGGNNPRVAEQLIINNVIHYKPVHDFAICNYDPAGSLNAASTGATTITGTSTQFTRDILPGDQLYTSETGTPEWVGTVSSVGSDTSLTLVTGAAISVGANDATWAIISTRVKRAGDNAPSTSLVFSGGALSSGVTPSTAYGTAGSNVIHGQIAGYDRYNFKFGINKRTYNQTPLLNTRGELTPVNSVDTADNVVRPAIGDLSEYETAMFNVNVTRFNPKTHIEASVSVVGPQVNI